MSVGLLAVQPYYTSLLIKWSQLIVPNCSTYKTFFFVSNLFCIASFLGVLDVSVDRFLAIHLHLRYQELVTHKRVVAVVILIWLLSACQPCLMLSMPLNIYKLIILIGGTVALMITTMVYIRIYSVITRHKNQIQALQVQPVAEEANFACLIKSAVGIFYVYLVFLVCYIPYSIS